MVMQIKHLVLLLLARATWLTWQHTLLCFALLRFDKTSYDDDDDDNDDYDDDQANRLSN